MGNWCGADGRMGGRAVALLAAMVLTACPPVRLSGQGQGQGRVALSGYLQPRFQALGDSGSIPIIDYNNIYQYAAAMTHSRGNHTLKWGTNIISRRMMQFQSGSAKGSFSFDSNPTSNGAGSGGNVMARPKSPLH